VTIRLIQSFAGQAAVAASGGGFATPDILPNEGFESGFGQGGGVGSWQDFSGNTTPTPTSGPYSVVISTTQAYQGTHSMGTTFGSGGGALACCYRFDGNGVGGNNVDHSNLHFWFRIYFYATALPNNPHKWIRPWSAGFGAVRNFLELSNDNYNGAIVWCNVENSDVGNDIGTGAPTLNTWHSIEVEDDRTNWATTGARARFWYDGNPVVGANTGAPNYYAIGNANPGAAGFGQWQDVNGNPANGPYYCTAVADSAAWTPGIITFTDTINSGNTNSGSIYYDRFAISSLGRIGP
jgi:hypothetical protein